MSVRATILLIITLCAATAWSDGPPMTPEGEVTVDHLEFRLSPEQLETVGRTRTVEFTPEQLAVCRKLNARFPGRLPVIGPSYADCTCGVGAYGMWIRPQRIAITTNTILGYDPESEKELEKSEGFFDERALSLQAQTDAVGAAVARRMLCMGMKGDFYSYGKAIAAAQVATVLSKLAANKEQEPYIFINIPPAGDAAIDAKVQDALKTLRAEGTKQGVKILITG